VALYCSVTAEVAGSSPVVPAIFLNSSKNMTEGNSGLTVAVELGLSTFKSPRQGAIRDGLCDSLHAHDVTFYE
jgi:hypothetical protein